MMILGGAAVVIAAVVLIGPVAGIAIGLVLIAVGLWRAWGLWQSWGENRNGP